MFGLSNPSNTNALREEGVSYSLSSLSCGDASQSSGICELMHSEGGGQRCPSSVLPVPWRCMRKQFEKNPVSCLCMPRRKNVLAFTLPGWKLSCDREETGNLLRWEFNMTKKKQEINKVQGVIKTRKETDTVSVGWSL